MNHNTQAHNRLQSARLFADGCANNASDGFTESQWRKVSLLITEAMEHLPAPHLTEVEILAPTSRELELDLKRFGVTYADDLTAPQAEELASEYRRERESDVR